MDHNFGGLWTRKKLDILQKYLAVYSAALKNQDFSLLYADAFAGTGNHVAGGNQADQSRLLEPEVLSGSARAALDVEPGFAEYHFNDLNPEHVDALKQLQAEYPDKHIVVSELDANTFVPAFCESLSWDDRAVLFIDPYSTEFHWATLEFVALSKKTDVWFLFPISALTRMTPKDGEKIKPEWKPKLDMLLGTDAWEEALYKPVEQLPMDDLFAEDVFNDATERLNIKELEKWVTKRLRSIFPYVSEPVTLKNNNRPLFSFYFLGSNPSPKAMGLAAKFVKHILKNET